MPGGSDGLGVEMDLRFLDLGGEDEFDGLNHLAARYRGAMEGNPAHQFRSFQLERPNRA